ncbi:MAG: hypothetical protein ACKOTB_02065 [Planctomycetia bacterium]
MEVLARIPELDLGPISPAPGAGAAIAEPGESATVEPARHVGRGAAPAKGARLPSLSVIALAIVAAAFWGAAWRNETRRLEAQRARPERLAEELPAGAGPTRIDSR